MVKSYFLLYKKAEKLYEQSKVKLKTVNEESNDETIYDFQSNGHEVSLKVSRIPNSRLWVRHWRCECHHFSLWQDKAECKHIKSCELYLMLGGYKDYE